MDFLKQNKMPIALGAILLIGIFVYMTFFSAPSSPALSVSDADTALTQNLLNSIQNLHTIKLDNTIFSDPAFQSLTDFGVTIPAEDVGRRNPFAPLGKSSSQSSGGVTIPLVKTK